MAREKTQPPASALVEAQRKLLHQLRATRSKWHAASGMGTLEPKDTAWSQTVWADTASPADDVKASREDWS